MARGPALNKLIEEVDLSPSYRRGRGRPRPGAMADVTPDPPPGADPPGESPGQPPAAEASPRSPRPLDRELETLGLIAAMIEVLPARGRRVILSICRDLLALEAPARERTMRWLLEYFESSWGDDDG